jgi:hypothetical protein
MHVFIIYYINRSHSLRPQNHRQWCRRRQRRDPGLCEEEEKSFKPRKAFDGLLREKKSFADDF